MQTSNQQVPVELRSYIHMASHLHNGESEGQRGLGRICQIENHTKHQSGKQNHASFALEKLKLKLHIMYSIDSIFLIILEISIGNFRCVYMYIHICMYMYICQQNTVILGMLIHSNEPKINNN